MAEEVNNALQLEGEQTNQDESASQEAAEEQRVPGDEEARIRAKYPQAPNARSALAQRRLAQAQSKKFFDSGDYNMAKATLRNTKLKKSAIAEPTTSTSAEVSTQKQLSEPGEKPIESRSDTLGESTEKSNLSLVVSETNSEVVKVRANEGECDKMNPDEAQRVVEHPPPPVLLAVPEPDAPSTYVVEALAAVTLRAAQQQRRSVQWPLGHADFAMAGANAFDRDSVRMRPLSSLVEADLPVEQRRRAETSLRDRDGSSAVFDTLTVSGVTESERQRILRHRHSTASGAFGAVPLEGLHDAASVPTTLLRGPTPNAVPMRRVSLIQQQNRGLLNVS